MDDGSQNKGSLDEGGFINDMVVFLIKILLAPWIWAGKLLEKWDKS